MPNNFVQKQYQDFLTQAKKNPQLTLLISNLKTNWEKYGYKIKVGLVIFFALIIVILGIRFGSTLAGLFRPAPVVPQAIPDITPVPTTVVNSQLQKIQAEIRAFNVLLPDPAAPAVDPNMYLETLPIEKD